MRDRIRQMIAEVDALEGVGKSLYLEPVLSIQFEKAMAWYGWAKHGHEHHDGRGNLFFVELDRLTQMMYDIHGYIFMEYC